MRGVVIVCSAELRACGRRTYSTRTCWTYWSSLEGGPGGIVTPSAQSDSGEFRVGARVRHRKFIEQVGEVSLIYRAYVGEAKRKRTIEVMTMWLNDRRVFVTSPPGEWEQI
jgi:hypothetical protein